MQVPFWLVFILVFTKGQQQKSSKNELFYCIFFLLAVRTINSVFIIHVILLSTDVSNQIGHVASVYSHQQTGSTHTCQTKSELAWPGLLLALDLVRTNCGHYQCPKRDPFAVCLLQFKPGRCLGKRVFLTKNCMKATGPCTKFLCKE